MIDAPVIKAPPSKSLTQRALAAAYLATRNGHVSVMNNPSRSDDAIAAVGIIRALGATVEDHKSFFRINKNDAHLIQKIELNCKGSALNLRLFTPIAGLLDNNIVMNGEGTLLKRAVLPVNVERLRPGLFNIDGSLTSQGLTGLLMALPCLEGDSEITVSDLKSKPYIEMTLQVLQNFGIEISNENFTKFKIKGRQKYKGTEFNVEGDWSGAAFILVAGAICGGIKIENLNANSLQADKKIIDILRDCGAKIVLGDNAVEVAKDKLRPFNFDVSDSPDLFPPLVALAVNCDGVSTITGIKRLKHKESDRVQALSKEFSKIGAVTEVFDDRMTIRGGHVTGGEVESHGDHRVVMALAVLGLNSSEGINIEGTECVSKSYPEFFSDLKEVKKL